MKKITKKSIAMYITFAVLIVFLTGAQCTIGGCTVTLYDYTGSAVNVKADGDSASYWKSSSTVTLEGATVKLIPLDPDTGAYTDGSSTITAVVGSDGKFEFLSLVPDRYKLIGEHAGWTFVPRYIEVAGSAMNFPDLLAYPTSSAGQITIITSWEDVNIDVDSILTYGDDDVNSNTSDWSSTNYDPGILERIKIDWQHPGSTTGIALDRDISSATVGSPLTDASIPRVETITIYNAANYLDDGDVAYFYVDSYFDEELGVPQTLYNGVNYQSLTGEEGKYVSAYAQVDVMFGTEHYGTWVLPWNTSEDTLKVLRIDYDTSSGDPITGVKDFMIASAGNSDIQYGGIKSLILE